MGNVRLSDAVDILGAVVIVAAVMMFVHPGSRGPELVRTLGDRFSEITSSAIVGGNQ